MKLLSICNKYASKKSKNNQNASVVETLTLGWMHQIFGEDNLG